MLVPVGPTQLRMSVYDHAGALVVLDASADLIGGPTSCEDTPNGCGAGSLTLGMTYEQVEALGYYSARNLIEISSGDDCIQTSISSGASKIYVGSNKGYDVARGHDQGQLAFFDGSTLTMRVPVTGVGTDGGGDFVTVGAPIAGFGNPTTLPAYIAGTTIYRRRYCGIIMSRQRANQKKPQVVIRTAGLMQRFAETAVDFALTVGTVDMGLALFDLVANFSDQWPELGFSTANFPATGWTAFDGSYQATMMSRVISDIVAAANSSGDQWFFRVGHDRIPRLTKLFTQSGDVYSYNVTLPQGVQYFEPRNFITTDQDATQLYNTVQVIGDTDQATQQPVSAIAQDATSVSLFGQIDAQPVTNTSCKTTAQCAQYAQALLNQQAAPRSNPQFIVSTRNDVSNAGPMGLSRGDVVLGVQNVTVSSFEGSAANVLGLASSVVTTYNPAGDTTQQVRFSSIMADWNQAIAARNNSIATAIMQNTQTQVGISSYMVSPVAYITIPPPAVGLVVTPPLFIAVFAQGTAPVAVGNTSFTLLAGATNWVWLLSNGAWVVNQNATPVTNAILYGIFTTGNPERLETESAIEITTESGTHIGTETGAIIGFTPMASVGLMILAQAQLPSMGSQAAPVLSGVSAITYPVVGNGTFDAAVTFTVDVVAAQWLVGLAMFAVAHGSIADPRDFPKGQIDVGQSNGAGQYTPVYKSIGAGNAEDLYVAYLDGQGRLSPVTLVGTTAANPAGTSAMGDGGTTAPIATTTLPATFSYFVNGGGTYDAEAAITLDSTGTTANNNLAEIECVISPAAQALGSASTGWAVAGNPIAVNATGIYTFPFGGQGVQVAYQCGLRYIWHSGARSNVLIVGTTTAQQLAQIPFQGAAVDPTTGFILISDQAIYQTTLQYQLRGAGVGALVAASWSMKTGATTDDPSVWLFYSSAGGDNGYVAIWDHTAGTVSIKKAVAGSYATLVTSPLAVTHDTTKFHDLELIATELVSGTVNLTATLDGNIMAQVSDSSTPFTSGTIAAQFRSASTNNLIDPKTIQITLAGDPSSSGIKAQASAFPISVPTATFNFILVGVTPPFPSSFMDVNIPTGPVVYPDGSVVTAPTFTSGATVGGEGLYFVMCAYNVFTNTYTTAIQAATPFTAAQKAAFVGDGLVPMAVNFSVDTTGSSTSAAFTINPNYGGRAL